MPKLSVTVDANANQKVLRALEKQGLIELHAMNIENMIANKKMTAKDKPLAVIGSPHATIENCVIAANDTIWPRVLDAMTKGNHGDALQLEGHIRSGRDIFVTDDNDFLARRDTLGQKFGVVIKSTQELCNMFN